MNPSSFNCYIQDHPNTAITGCRIEQRCARQRDLEEESFADLRLAISSDEGGHSMFAQWWTGY